jgi:hypothetical protein
MPRRASANGEIQHLRDEYARRQNGYPRQVLVSDVFANKKKCEREHYDELGPSNEGNSRVHKSVWDVHGVSSQYYLSETS